MNDDYKELEKRVSSESDRQFILEKLKTFRESSDRGELNRIAADLFPYEKKYMKKHGKGCSVLIITVGMREAPIIFSFLALRPKKGILLHTSQSEMIADKVISDHNIADLGIKFEKVEIDEIDAAKNFQILKDSVLSRIKHANKNANGVLVDPTGGRKVMGASIATFAFFYRIPMVYLHAEEQLSVPVPFTGQIKEIANPYEHYGDIELSMLKRHFERYDFGAALGLCKELEGTVNDQSLYLKLQQIEKLIEIYRDWDSFLHSTHFQKPPSKEAKASIRLADRLETLYRKEMKRFGYNFINEKDLEANLEFLQKLQETWDSKKNLCDPYRLVDLYANACRRAEQGKYDDATARLYRCLEMCANISLENAGIGDLRNPDYEAFASQNKIDLETLMEKFREISGFGSPRNPPGLDDQMFLLEIAGFKAAQLYSKMKQFEEDGESLRDKRNRSILAHGTSPITNNDYEALASWTTKIISSTLGKKEFNQLAGQVIFPELNI